MRYVDFEEMTRDQRNAAVTRYKPEGVAWIVGHAYAVKADGTLAAPRYQPRISNRIAKEKLAAMLAERDSARDPPEKGGIRHFKTAKFGLNKEKP